MSRRSQVIAISSGKGGTGKSSICANLGILLSRQGLKICIVDADHGLANINIILGLPPSNPAFNLFTSPQNYSSCIQSSKYEVDVLSSRSGISLDQDSVTPEVEQIEHLFQLLSEKYDVVLVDTGAGINPLVRNYLAVADYVILTLSPEPTSLTDSFGLIRAMQSVNDSYQVITNRVSGAAQARNIHKRFCSAVKEYIGLDVALLGYVNDDSYAMSAVLRQIPLVNHHPDGAASRCLMRISQAVGRNIEFTKSRLKPVPSPAELPADPTFIKQQRKPATAFDMWLQQMPQFFDNAADSSEEQMRRFNLLREKLWPVVANNPGMQAEIDNSENTYLNQEPDRRSSTRAELLTDITVDSDKEISNMLAQLQAMNRQID